MNMSDNSNPGDVVDPDVRLETTVAKTAGETQPNEEMLAKRRLEKIRQYLVESLDQEDAWRGCVGPIVCDLLEMCQKLKACLDEELGQAGSFLGALASLEPAFNTYLRIVRQVERLSKLDYRIRGIAVGQPRAATSIDTLPEMESGDIGV